MKKIGIILASGSGSRFGGDVSKQFMLLNNKHVITYSVEEFVKNKSITKIIVVLSKDNINYGKEILKQYINDVSFVIGGNSRTKSLNNAINYLENNYDLSDEDFVLVHDSARPLINQDIIDLSISKMNEYNCVTVVTDSVDSVIQSKNGINIDKTIDRNQIFKVQTPQTFKIKKYIEYFNKLDEKTIESLTDSTKVFINFNEDVGLIQGGEFLKKITNKQDLEIIKCFIKQ